MSEPTITIVLQGNTYTLRCDDPEGLREVTEQDRDHLIRLLQALKLQQQQSQQRVARALSTGGAASSTAPVAAPAERMGAGDIDTLMARLAMEEQQQKKSRGIKPSTIYKVAAALIAVIILLSIW